MPVSVFELFTVGVGPSSSHTVGPMRAACAFAESLRGRPVARVEATLYGSLAATGVGHGTDAAVLAGLCGHDPERVDPEALRQAVDRVRRTKTLTVAGSPVPFEESADLLSDPACLPFHPNGLRLRAFDGGGRVLREKTVYSVGGGFVVDPEDPPPEPPPVPHPFRTARELVRVCEAEDAPISEIVLRNERAARPEAEVRERLLQIWSVMEACVEAGCANAGILPGGLNVRRRAAALAGKLREDPAAEPSDWLSVWAIAVNEENAAGGRVVTAPTNGAAGIIPSVLMSFRKLRSRALSEEQRDDATVRFLLTAAAVGQLCKENASISGAEVGCQGEVGSACAMAAAGLAEVTGGTPAQVENAAEIAMEHNLGLTCDPIGGLVQVPCIERNAMAAVKAVTASRLALRGDGQHMVSLDRVIATMRSTGADMQDKYKETSRGGLAVHLTEC